MSRQRQHKGLSRPPKRGAEADAFISGAEAKEVPAAELGGYPWEDPKLRADVTKVYNLRLPEPLYAKLRWLKDQGPESMHEIALGAVEREVEARVKELTGK